MKRIDLTGQKYGYLHVLRQGEKSGKHTTWLCLCECGKEHRVSTTTLRKGEAKSCGCRSFTPERRREISEMNRRRLTDPAFKQKTIELLTSKNMAQARTDGIRQSPICTGPTSLRAELWSLKSPDGRVFQFKNLTHFIDTHTELFTEDQLKRNRQGHTRARANLCNLSPRRKNNCETAYGWTWHINGEADELGRVYAFG